jgi:hypothetical protein
MKNQTSSPKDILASIESYLEELVEKFPKMSDKVSEIIVSISPWGAILGIIMLVPVVLALFGLSAFLSPFAMMAGAGVGFSMITASISSIILIVLYGMAIPGLFKRQKAAWDKMYWAYLIGLVVNIVNFEVVGFVIGGLVGAYVLFSVKKYYK